MKKSSIFIILAVALNSCVSTTITLTNDNSQAFCRDINNINKLICNDKEVWNYFSIIKKDSSTFFFDNKIELGIDMLFFGSELAEIRSKDPSKTNRSNVYSELMIEQKQYYKKRTKIPLNCTSNTLPRSSCNLEISYLLSPKDSVYTVYVDKILKEHGYHKGYAFLMSGNNGNVKILKRTFWTE